MLALKEEQALLEKELVSPKKGKARHPIYLWLVEQFLLQKISKNSLYQEALKFLESLHQFMALCSMKLLHKSEILAYMEALGMLIELYEKEHFLKKAKKATGIEVLKELMREHGLKQADLKKELGTQSYVSELLHKKRSLNLKQIRALAKRFGLSPLAFIG